jgi:hypothetical protein
MIEDEHGNPITLTEPADQEVQAKAQGINAELARRRQILNADQMTALVAPRARFETEFAKYGCYFFSINGVLNGRKITGAMFAGQCILVRAENFAKAQELANAGLRSTSELIHREYETRSLRGDDMSPIEQGIAKEVAGRRGREGDGLASNPKLKHMLEHVIGGLPWKW